MRLSVEREVKTARSYTHFRNMQESDRNDCQSIDIQRGVAVKRKKDPRRGHLIRFYPTEVMIWWQRRHSIGFYPTEG